jgi:hypothetical protein
LVFVALLVILLGVHVVGEPTISAGISCAGPGRLKVSLTVTAGSGETLTKVTAWLNKCQEGSNVWYPAGTILQVTNPASPYSWGTTVSVEKDHYYTMTVKVWYRGKGKNSDEWRMKETGSVICKDVYSTTNGGDPPIWGKIMAFPTIERHMGRDLNGDGDTDDTVLRYMNIETGEVVNTGAIVSGLSRAISIYGDVIAFVGERGMIRYYRISTGEIKDVGMAGSTPSLYDNTLVFSSSGRILLFDLTKATLFDPNIQGLFPTIYGNLVAFESGGTIRYYDLVSGITVDTGVLGSSPFLWGDIIAFIAWEESYGQDLNNDGDELDAIISYYRISTRETVYTGVVGSFPQVYGDVIVFHTYEWAEGKDLNGDGQILGSVIRYWSIADGEVVNTGILGTEPSVYQDTITYYVWENWVGHDLTGDGDSSDTVVNCFHISDRVWAHRGADKE